MCGYQVAQAIVYESMRWGVMVGTPERVVAWAAVAWSVGACFAWTALRSRLARLSPRRAVLVLTAIVLPTFWADLYVLAIINS